MADQELPASKFIRPQSAGDGEELFDSELNANPPGSAAQTVSMSFKFLVGAYLCLGLLSIALSVTSALKGSFYVDSTVLFLVIGIGLYRRTRPWRTFGVVFSVIIVLGGCILGLIVGRSWGSYRDLLHAMAETAAGEHGATLALIAFGILLFAILGLSVWSIFVLTRPSVRAVFKSNERRRFGNIGALCVLLAAVTLARETGGLNINLATTKYRHSTSDFRTGPSLSDLGAQAPLIVNIEGIGIERASIITELDAKHGTTTFGRTTTNRSWKYESYSGAVLVSKANCRFPQAQHVRVEISRLDIEGAYWLPLMKTGKASFEVTAQGLDGLSEYGSIVSGHLSFSRMGLSSAHDLLREIRVKVADFGVKQVIKSATAKVTQRAQ